MKNQIWAIYARNQDGAEDIISEEREGMWTPYCSQDFSWISALLETAKGVCEAHGRVAVLKTFTLSEERVL